MRDDVQYGRYGAFAHGTYSLGFPYIVCARRAGHAVSAVGEYGGGRLAVALGACCRDVEFDVSVEEVPARIECCRFGREDVSRDGGVGCECFAGVWTDEAPATVDQRKQCSTEDGNEDARADQEFNVKRCIRHLWCVCIC